MASLMMTRLTKTYNDDVIHWLKTIVIGLNFCPFARKPFESNCVRIVCEEYTQEDAILELVLLELNKLEETKASEIETTLIVLPKAYPDFHDFNSLVFVLNNVLELEGFEGIFQIASFHPAYQFAGTDTDDIENYTNRAPYPVLHLIREESISFALELHPDPDGIPDKNILCLKSLSVTQLKDYFSYLYK
ncbi:MAG: hypothetical protein ACJAS1_004537 [Oleiphilaceae bacterium]|jgi:hypothetical protein